MSVTVEDVVRIHNDNQRYRTRKQLEAARDAIFAECEERMARRSKAERAEARAAKQALLTDPVIKIHKRRKARAEKRARMPKPPPGPQQSPRRSRENVPQAPQARGTAGRLTQAGTTHRSVSRAGSVRNQKTAPSGRLLFYRTICLRRRSLALARPGPCRPGGFLRPAYPVACLHRFQP